MFEKIASYKLILASHHQFASLGRPCQELRFRQYGSISHISRGTQATPPHQCVVKGVEYKSLAVHLLNINLETL